MGGVRKEEEEELEGLNAKEEWDSVGWSLWEKAEQEKAGLEETNQKLNRQIQELRAKIEQCKRIGGGGGGGGEKRESNIEMFSLLGQMDGLVGQLLSEKGDGEK